jgi:hypothetical protein
MKLLLAIISLLLIIKASHGLHLNFSHEGQSLEEIWKRTQYLEGDVMISRSMKFDKISWIERYMTYFDVPKWLAQEKFDFCDDDHN